jgi:hypothetical protein
MKKLKRIEGKLDIALSKQQNGNDFIADVVALKGTFYCGKHHYHCEGRCDKQCKDCVGNTPQ